MPMPLSELLRILARGNLEADDPSPNLPDTMFRPINRSIELVCENGQIKMQSKSSSVSTNPAMNNLQGQSSHISTNTAAMNNLSSNAPLGNFGGVEESMVNHIPPAMPTSDFNLSQDEMGGPRFSNRCPIDVGLPQGYGSDLLPIVSADITSNGIFSPMNNNFQSGQVVSNLECGGDINYLGGCSSIAPPTQSWSLPQQSQFSDALGPGVADIISNNAFGNQAECSRDIVNDATLVLPTTKSSILSFSPFPNSGDFVQPDVGIEDVEFQDKGLSASGSNPAIFKQFISTEKDTTADFNVSPPPKVVNVSSRQPDVVEVTKEYFFPVERSTGKQLADDIGKLSKRVLHEGERGTEQMINFSSIGSDHYRAHHVSCEREHVHNSKRRIREVERNDDIEKKATAAKGRVGVPRKPRAAEVHSIAERRRRGRINEKMRVIQELIPNCSKGTDKASLLEEATEYLKKLKFQLHAMTMGAGLYTP